jgi:hypothetical protein
MTTHVRRLFAILTGVATVSVVALTGAANAHSSDLAKPTSTKTVVVEAFPHPAGAAPPVRPARHV